MFKRPVVQAVSGMLPKSIQFGVKIGQEVEMMIQKDRWTTVGIMVLGMMRNKICTDKPTIARMLSEEGLVEPQFADAYVEAADLSLHGADYDETKEAVRAILTRTLPTAMRHKEDEATLDFIVGCFLNKEAKPTDNLTRALLKRAQEAGGRIVKNVIKELKNPSPEE